MDKLISGISARVRSWMVIPARAINKLSRGKITPNHITLVSLLGHLSVVWALSELRPILAAALLAFFGLMDSLDGALARLQKSTSVQGMFYDAVSDRAKEILVYIGIALFLPNVFLHNLDGLSEGILRFSVNNYLQIEVWLVVALCGLSLLISYIKAKGEMALAGSGKYSSQQLNRVFSDGLARYEVRMAVVIVGLLSGRILVALVVLLILLVFTALQRFVRISKALSCV